MSALPQRVIDQFRGPVDAAPATFQARPDHVRPEDVAPDMGDLAARVRNLMELQQGRPLQMPLGGSLFDVVVTAAGDAARAVVSLMDDVQYDGCGPVIDDPERSWMCWLVPPGTSAQWAPNRYGVCLGRPYQIVLPQMTKADPPGAYWLRPCRGDRLVPPVALRQLLNQFQPGPVPHETLMGSVLSGTT